MIYIQAIYAAKQIINYVIFIIYDLFGIAN